MTTSIRSERYTVRPFQGLAPADDALQNVRLIVNGDENEAGTIVLPETVLTSANLVLRLPHISEIRSRLRDTQVPDVDCGLVVMLTGMTHRASKILLGDHLRISEYPVEYVIDREPKDIILNDRAGFTITVAVVLLNQLNPRPLQPYLAGTWLSRRTFRVVPERDDKSFSPQPLTDQIRADLGIPPETLNYIYVDQEALLDCEAISDALIVYVDEDALNLLLQSPSDKFAIQLQAELATTAMNVVAQSLISAIRESNGGAPVTEQSVAQHSAAKSFFDHLAQMTNRSVNQLLHASGQTDMLRALLASAFQMRRSTTSALKES